MRGSRDLLLGLVTSGPGRRLRRRAPCGDETRREKRGEERRGRPGAGKGGRERGCRRSVGTGRGCVRRPGGRSGRGLSERVRWALRGGCRAGPGCPRGPGPAASRSSLRPAVFPRGLLPALPSAAAAGPRPSAGSGRGTGGRRCPGGVPSLWRGGAGRGANPPPRPPCPETSAEPRGWLPAPVRSAGVCRCAASPDSTPLRGPGTLSGWQPKKRETVSPSQSPYGCWRSLEGRVATCRCLRARLVAAAQLHPWEVLPLSSWQPAGLKIMAFKNWKRRLMRSSVLLKI